MEKFKLLNFPAKDRTLGLIDSLSKDLVEDESGEYLDETLLMLTNWASEFAPGESREIDRFEQKIIEARQWLWEYYSDEMENNKPIAKEEEK